MIYIYTLSLSTYTLIITKLYFYEIRKNAFPIGLTHYTYYSEGVGGLFYPLLILYVCQLTKIWSNKPTIKIIDWTVRHRITPQKIQIFF